MIEWIKKNIKIAREVFKRSDNKDMFHLGYETAMNEVLDEMKTLKVDVNGELLSVERIDIETEGNIIVVSASSLERRFK